MCLLSTTLLASLLEANEAREHEGGAHAREHGRLEAVLDDLRVERGATLHQTRRADAAEAAADDARARLLAVAGDDPTAARVAALDVLLTQVAAAAAAAEAITEPAAVAALDDVVDAAAVAATLALRDAQETAFAAGADAVALPGDLRVTLAEIHRAGGGRHHLHVAATPDDTPSHPEAGRGDVETSEQRPVGVPVGAGGGRGAPWWPHVAVRVYPDVVSAADALAAGRRPVRPGDILAEELYATRSALEADQELAGAVEVQGVLIRASLRDAGKDGDESLVEGGRLGVQDRAQCLRGFSAGQGVGTQEAQK